MDARDAAIVVHERERPEPGPAQRLPRDPEEVAAHARGDLGRAEADEPPQRREQRVPLAPRVSPHGIEHDIDAAGREAADGVGPARVAAVDGLDTVGPQDVVLAGRGEPDDPEAQDPAQLRHRESDTTRGGVDQDRFPGTGGGGAHQQMMRGEIDDGERGALLEAPPLGQGEDSRRRYHHQLALPPEPRHRDDAVAPPRRRNVARDGIHNP